jgi:hypothetical protein
VVGETSRSNPNPQTDSTNYLSLCLLVGRVTVTIESLGIASVKILQFKYLSSIAKEAVSQGNAQSKVIPIVKTKNYKS